MEKEYEILGASRVVQYESGNSKVQISNELKEDVPMFITFIAMNVEVLANQQGIEVDKVLEMIKQNIETEPMEFG